METLKHAKITTITPLDDSTVSISEESYTDQLKGVTVRTQKNIKTSDMSLLADYVECLGAFKRSETEELEVVVRRDRKGTILITKTWTIKKERY